MILAPDTTTQLIDQAIAQPKLGLEIEMVVANAITGASTLVNHYFDSLAVIKRTRGVAATPSLLQGRCIALHTPVAVCGLDNGYNLLETALEPVAGGPGGLGRLAVVAHQELADTLQALQADDCIVLNGSQHPACERSPAWYQKACVPRPIYKELVGYRGWQHREGMDAKAQNGANTSIPVHQAARALNIMIGLAAAQITLFANSPLESGQITGRQENRLTLWPRVFGAGRFAGDAILARYPQRPFHDLGDYFRWMFQPGTVTRSLPAGLGGDYKSVPTVLLQHDPSLYEFLHAREWTARRMNSDTAMVLQPQTLHFLHSQIAQFLDARWRYTLLQPPELPELLRAWQQEGGLENLFAQCGISGYLEGRAPGAGFADACLLREAGAGVARSVLMAPIALQQGLLHNAGQAWDLVRDQGWANLGRLREQAIVFGLGDPATRRLCAQVLDIARDGLDQQDRHWLDYPYYVLASGRTGADRLLETWTRKPADGLQQRLANVAVHHRALHPDRYL